MPERCTSTHATTFESARGVLALGYAVLALITLFFAIWATTFQLAGAIVAQGAVELDDHARSIEHPLGGMVNQVFVREGDKVTAGDILFTLQTSALETQLNFVSYQLADLAARRAMLIAEQDGNSAPAFGHATTIEAGMSSTSSALQASYTRLFNARQKTITREISQLRRQIIQNSLMITGIQAQLDASLQQRTMVKENLDKQRALLTKGLTQSAQVSELEQSKARLDGALGQFKADIARAKAEQARLEIAILHVTSIAKEKAATELRDVETRIMELTAFKSSLDETREQMIVRAPIAGIVHDTRVFAAGAVINPSDVVMQIVPEDRPMSIIVKLEPSQIDQIEIGQDAQVRLMSHSAQDHPLLDGVVEQISAQALIDDKSGLSFFRVSIGLKDQIPSTDARLKIIAGMQADVHLRTKDRTALAYLLDPLLVYIHRAFRET